MEKEVDRRGGGREGVRAGDGCGRGGGSVSSNVCQAVVESTGVLFKRGVYTVQKASYSGYFRDASRCSGSDNPCAVPRGSQKTMCTPGLEASLEPGHTPAMPQMKDAPPPPTRTPCTTKTPVRIKGAQYRNMAN